MQFIPSGVMSNGNAVRLVAERVDPLLTAVFECACRGLGALQQVDDRHDRQPDNQDQADPEDDPESSAVASRPKAKMPLQMLFTGAQHSGLVLLVVQPLKRFAWGHAQDTILHAIPRLGIGVSVPLLAGCAA